MITKRFIEWFQHRWVTPDDTIARDYQATFGTLSGQRVLQHLLDNVYCTIYEGNDPNGPMILNARRSVIHEILQTLDAVEHPQKYVVPVADTTNILEVPNGMAR